MATNDQLATLRAAVLEAFANVPPPRPDRPDLYTRENAVFAGIQRLGDDTSTNWSNLSNEFIEANCEELALVSAEAFHYYIPALFIYAIDHWKNSNVWNWTLTHFSTVPHKQHRVGQDEHNRARFGLFSEAQMQTIYSFLDLILEDTQDWINWTAADCGKRYLMSLFEPSHVSPARITDRSSFPLRLSR